jgi:hypothetical protein
MTDATETTRVALDQSACIRSQSNIGDTITHNICDGTTAVVPWGSADWLGFVAIAGIGTMFALILIGLVVMIVRTETY